MCNILLQSGANTALASAFRHFQVKRPFAQAREKLRPRSRHPGLRPQPFHLVIESRSPRSVEMRGHLVQ